MIYSEAENYLEALNLMRYFVAVKDEHKHLYLSLSNIYPGGHSCNVISKESSISCKLFSDILNFA